ncbi:hypothetical protein LCGC14_3094790 [marine sediment metagenome]|uniref:Uncharacterized protein n=1 Tax=marine sediment metagenome TaxID=412755 RepID=A0A0F8W9J4_9ZZZZ
MQALPLPEFTKQDIARFWAKVDRQDGCWPWTAGVTTEGYGRFRISRRLLGATRVAHFLTTGLDDPSKDVCHTCDNPICCNPIHLWLGTRAENMQDAFRKGRGVTPPGSFPGELHPHAKLTEEDVHAIRVLLDPRTMRLRDIADSFGVSIRTITKIRDGEVWKHLI